MKKFWETEDGQSFHEIPIVRIDEQIAMKKVEKSMEYENQMYRVGVPWKDNKPCLLDNYCMAFHKLENTEMRLKRSPDVATTYNPCIEQYIKKGNIRKVPVYEQPRSKWYLPHFPVIRLDPFRVVLGWAYRDSTGGFLLLQNFSVAISVSPHVCKCISRHI